MSRTTPENVVRVAIVGEEDEVLLGQEVLDDLDVMAADVELLVEGIDNVAGVSVMAVASEPADRRLAN